MKAARAESAQTHFFPEIEGLRVYLALWVAVGHGMQTAGFLTPGNAAERFLLSGHDAVVVFMIVSGFVITNLLIAQDEPYPRYIVRRFFRLYPVFLAGCALGLAAMGPWVAVMRAVAWQDVAGWADYRALVETLADQSRGNWLRQGIAHALMIHGALPDGVLLLAPLTFLPAAWSISLEWQFYLIAPLVVRHVRSAAAMTAAAAIALAAWWAWSRGHLGSYPVASTLAANSQWFAAGIASRVAYPRMKAMAVPPVAAAAVVGAMAAMLLEDALPAVLWAVFLAFSLWGRDDGPGRLYRAVFTNRLATVFGKASYSLYLIHRPLQVLLAWALLDVVAGSRGAMLLCELAATATALPLSVALYRLIERPGMAAGRWAAACLPSARPSLS